MKNVRENQLKKCIFLTDDEFKSVFAERFSKYEDVDVEIDAYEGIYFCGISNEEVYKNLSEYFDVEITSIHIDDCEYTGVWIVYKE